MKRHALFVGVDQYDDGHIPNLSCAVSDATDLHGFFKYGAGYDSVELLRNPAGKKEVLDSVRRLTAGLGPGDLFLFFFAGHGFCVREDHMLVCAKDLYEDVRHENDGLPLGQLKRRMSGSFDRAILLDACQSDILSTRGGEGMAERDISLIHDLGPRHEREGALAIVTSCDAGQTAGELADRRHGLFTMAMLDILESSAQAHRQVDLSDAFRVDLGARMREIAADAGLPTEQRPRFSSTGSASLVILDGEPCPDAPAPSDGEAPPPPMVHIAPLQTPPKVPLQTPPPPPAPPSPRLGAERGGTLSNRERELVAELCRRLAPEWRQSHGDAVSALLDADSAGSAVDALDAVVDIVVAEFAGANGVNGLMSPGGLRHRPRSYQNLAPSVVLFGGNSRDVEADALHLAQESGPSRVCAALGRVFVVAKLFAR